MGDGMGRPSTSLRVRVSRPELSDELLEALTAGACVCARLDHRTMLVVHREAVDEVEARLELRFFLRAWEHRHGDVQAELL